MPSARDELGASRDPGQPPQPQGKEDESGNKGARNYSVVVVVASHTALDLLARAGLTALGDRDKSQQN